MAEVHPIEGAEQQTADDEPENRAIRQVGDQFLASLNHDVRTPLSGILGMTDLLLETDLSQEQRDYVNTTRLCADNLLEMLNAALEFTALCTGELKLQESEFHLPAAVRDTVAEYVPKAESKGVEMSCEISDGVPECVIGDAVRLGELLSPLLNNACKFTPRGRIDVTASSISNGDHGVRLRVDIRDTGIGIASEKLPTIFESFRQLENGLSRTYPGLGLGLAMARKLAETMGGDISVESELEAGSTFRVEIPLCLPSSAGDGTAAGDAAREDAKPQVLLVEDNDVARRIVTHMLERAGYVVHCATGGREGIGAATEADYDLILMDIQMPDVNGLDAAAAIRKLPERDRTPIVALSANFSDEFRQHCRNAGFQAFIPKPIQRDELLRTIERHLPK